jgi:hypothetical protein
MIDNYQKANALVLEMQKAVPFDVCPSKQLVNILKEKIPHFNTNTKIKVIDINYADDEGGILCSSYIGTTNEVFVVSLTHLTLDTKSPFYKAAKIYQENRIKKLFLKNIGFGNLK